MDKLVAPPTVTSDFAYFILISDRRVAESRLGKVQFNRSRDKKSEWKNKKNSKESVQTPCF
jgi:hypothetical protein